MQRHSTLSTWEQSILVCGTYHPIHIIITAAKEWEFTQEGGGNALQGFSRPLIEPVDGTAVHKGGELPQACTEHFSDRAEGEACRDVLQLALHTRTKYLSFYRTTLILCGARGTGIHPGKEGKGE